MKNAIEYSNDPYNFSVKYHAPSRDFKDFRSECDNDALLLKSKGPLYVSFSSGIDSQLIARCFIDQHVDAEYVFLYSEGYNDIEYEHVKQCEKFFGIKVNVFNIDINKFKDEWILRSRHENPPRMHHYQFEYLSKILPEKYPIVFQGANEPAIVGTGKKVSIYHNYYDGMHVRMKMMSKYREVIDFPFSPECVASYYTDNIVKGFAHSMKYLNDNKLSRNNSPIGKMDHFEYFCKPILKGFYFKDQLIWYKKLNGYENYPDWIVKQFHVKESRVSAPYWDLVEFLENSRTGHREYSGWIFDPETPGFITLNNLTVF